jgi:hypothetical protein
MTRPDVQLGLHVEGEKKAVAPAGRPVTEKVKEEVA